MIRLDEYNKKMMESYGLSGQQWRKSDVACSKCPEEVTMLEKVDMVLTTHPPKVKVQCPKCKLLSYKIV